MIPTTVMGIGIHHPLRLTSCNRRAVTAILGNTMARYNMTTKAVTPSSESPNIAANTPAKREKHALARI
jgi:hypothetical protein